MAGDLVRDTGDVRKLRWGAEGRGKRGGIRVIYFFHNRQLPLFLLIFAFTAGAVRNWEQGKRTPEGPARVLLTITAREPDAVVRALRQAA